MIPFKDRADAGKMLVPKLMAYAKKSNTVVLGLARGGMVTAAEIADALQLPLDVMIVRKLGAPDHEELALGAITDDGYEFWNRELVEMMAISKEYREQVLERERKEAQHRAQLYRSAQSALDLAGKTVLLVDDGIATGASMEVAIKAARARKAHNIIVVVPVLPPDTLERLRSVADDVVFLEAPEAFYGIGQFYADFTQVTHDIVIALLKKNKDKKRPPNHLDD